MSSHPVNAVVEPSRRLVSRAPSFDQALERGWANPWMPSIMAWRAGTFDIMNPTLRYAQDPAGDFESGGRRYPVVYRTHARTFENHWEPDFVREFWVIASPKSATAANP